MKNKFLIFLIVINLYCFHIASAQPGIHYTYNGHLSVKQGASLANLKNPFTGGFELPQFSNIDLNLDGIQDLMIFDRGTKKFYTFLNDGIPNTISYTYAPQYESKFPTCETFCLTYDYNNDGKMDLLMEAYGLILQYKNTGLATLSFAIPDTLYSYDGYNVYCPSTNIPSFNDIDNDGDMDILTWNSVGNNIELYKNFRVEKGMSTEQWKYKLVDECWGKFSLYNSILLGDRCKGIALWPNGDDYTPPPMPNGGGAHNGSTLLTLDIDSDGDYEALEGDIYYNFLYFLENGKKDFNYPKDSMIAKDSLYPSPAQRMQLMNFPAAYFLDVNNDGKRDIILAPNDNSGASKNKNQIYLYKNVGTDRKPIFNLVQNDFLANETIDEGGGSAPSFVDIDNDGDDDLFLASHGEATSTLNSHDVIAYYKNTGTLLNPVFVLQDTNFLNLSAKGYSGIKPCFGDLNGDGKKDLIFGESNGKLKYYINTSVGTTISFTENTTQFASFLGRNYSAPYLVDFNRDGKLDLFLGNYDGTVSYYQNTGTVSNPVFTKTVDSVGKICLRAVDDARNFYQDGMSVPVVADLDLDGKFDLLVGGRYGLYIYKNIENKMGDSLVLTDTVVRFALSQQCVKKFTGQYVSPAIAQLDSDSVYFDLMIGNNGGGVTVFSTYDYRKVGINNYSRHYQKLNIIPNPATDKIIVDGYDKTMYHMQIFDVAGKEILEDDGAYDLQTGISIATLKPGIYFITLTCLTGETFNGKFVKM